MRNPIKTVAILKHEREPLKEKAWQMSLKYGDMIIEADLIHFMIENMLDMIDCDRHGLYVVEKYDETSAEAESGKVSSKAGSASSNASGKGVKTTSRSRGKH